MDYSVYASGIGPPPKKPLYLVHVIDYVSKFCTKKIFEEAEPAQKYFSQKVKEYREFLSKKNYSSTETTITFYSCSYLYGKDKVSEVSLSFFEV